MIVLIRNKNILHTIHTYDNLTHRGRLKLRHSFLHRRINFLRHESNYANSFVAFEYKIRHPRAKMPIPKTANTLIQWPIGAPKYYLKDTKTDEIITMYPRKYLSLLFKLEQFNKWKNKNGHQSQHIRDWPNLQNFIFTTSFLSVAFHQSIFNISFPSLPSDRFL